MRCLRHPRALRYQLGYSLLELMIAITISVFLLGGLFTILQSTRDTSTNQNLLAQLQDGQRIAMTLMTDVVEQAGYYPGAYSSAMGTEFPAGTIGGVTWAGAGQLAVGAANSTAALGDTLAVRYQPDASGTTIGCTGLGDSSAVHVYQFTIAAVNGVNSLVCSVDGGSQLVLAKNVSKLSVLYGTYSAGTTALAPGNVDSYLTATQLNAAANSAILWSNIYSVKITLSFVNPLYGQPGQTSQTVTFTRVISLMSKTGVNVSAIT